MLDVPGGCDLPAREGMPGWRIGFRGATTRDEIAALLPQSSAMAVSSTGSRAVVGQPRFSLRGGTSGVYRCLGARMALRRWCPGLEDNLGDAMVGILAGPARTPTRAMRR